MSGNHHSRSKGTKLGPEWFSLCSALPIIARQSAIAPSYDILFPSSLVGRSRNRALGWHTLSRGDGEAAVGGGAEDGALDERWAGTAEKHVGWLWVEWRECCFSWMSSSSESSWRGCLLCKEPSFRRRAVVPVDGLGASLPVRLDER